MSHSKTGSKPFSSLSDLLQTITPTNKVTFHETLENNRNKIIQFYSCHPHFKYLIPQHHRKQKFANKTLNNIKPKQPSASVSPNQKQNPLQNQSNIIENNESTNHSPQVLSCSTSLPVLSKKKSSSEIALLNDNERQKEEKQKIAQLLKLLHQNIRRKPKAKRLFKEEKGFQLTKFNKLLDKCDIEIKNATVIDNRIEKKNLKYKKLLNEIREQKNKINQNNDRPLIEEGNNKKGKYKLLQERTLIKMKRGLSMKISENLAFENQKEYKAIIKEYILDNPYEFHLRDLVGVINYIEKKKEKENEEMTYIENILEDTSKNKEYLKHKIDEHNKKHRAYMKENKSNCVLNFKSENSNACHIKASSLTPSARPKKFEEISREVFDHLSKQMIKKNKTRFD